MERISEKAAQATIRDLGGNELPLEKTWLERTALVAFVRHFG
jgi:hypothetical protein